MDAGDFRAQLSDRGFVIVPALLSSDQVERIASGLADAIERCALIRAAQGVEEANEGIAHHLLGLGGVFLDFVDRLPLLSSIESFLGGPIIINSFSGFSHRPKGTTYAGGIHRDIRSFFGEIPMMVNMLVMLDEFTAENGATYLLPGSHAHPDKPDERHFFANAQHALGQRGSVLVFHSQLWHASGHNSSSHERRALTLTLTRPFYKQQADYARLVGYNRGQTLTENQRQLIGYNSRVPASLEEWYQPLETRMYKPGQG